MGSHRRSNASESIENEIEKRERRTITDGGQVQDETQAKLDDFNESVSGMVPSEQNIVLLERVEQSLAEQQTAAYRGQWESDMQDAADDQGHDVGDRSLDWRVAAEADQTSDTTDTTGASAVEELDEDDVEALEEFDPAFDEIPATTDPTAEGDLEQRIRRVINQLRSQTVDAQLDRMAPEQRQIADMENMSVQGTTEDGQTLAARQGNLAGDQAGLTALQETGRRVFGVESDSGQNIDSLAAQSSQEAEEEIRNAVDESLTEQTTQPGDIDPDLDIDPTVDERGDTAGFVQQTPEDETVLRLDDESILGEPHDIGDDGEITIGEAGPGSTTMDPYDVPTIAEVIDERDGLELTLGEADQQAVLTVTRDLRYAKNTDVSEDIPDVPDAFTRVPFDEPHELVNMSVSESDAQTLIENADPDVDSISDLENATDRSARSLLLEENYLLDAADAEQLDRFADEFEDAAIVKETFAVSDMSIEFNSVGEGKLSFHGRDDIPLAAEEKLTSSDGQEMQDIVTAVKREATFELSDEHQDNIATADGEPLAESTRLGTYLTDEQRARAATGDLSAAEYARAQIQATLDDLANDVNLRKEGLTTMLSQEEAAVIFNNGFRNGVDGLNQGFKQELSRRASAENTSLDPTEYAYLHETENGEVDFKVHLLDDISEAASDVNGIGSQSQGALAQSDIETVADLAKATDAAIRNTDGLSTGAANSLIEFRDTVARPLYNDVQSAADTVTQAFADDAFYDEDLQAILDSDTKMSQLDRSKLDFASSLSDSQKATLYETAVRTGTAGAAVGEFTQYNTGLASHPHLQELQHTVGSSPTTIVDGDSYDLVESQTAVEIGRGATNPLGNPFRLETDGGSYTREESVREYINSPNALGRLDSDVTTDAGNTFTMVGAEPGRSYFGTVVSDASGKVLSGHCAPELCHGDALAAYHDVARERALNQADLSDTETQLLNVVAARTSASDNISLTEEEKELAVDLYSESGGVSEEVKAAKESLVEKGLLAPRTDPVDGQTTFSGQDGIPIKQLAAGSPDIELSDETTAAREPESHPGFSADTDSSDETTVIIAGSRSSLENLSPEARARVIDQTLENASDELDVTFDTVISGGADGADTAARQWAEEANATDRFDEFDLQNESGWIDKFGYDEMADILNDSDTKKGEKAYARNERMAEEADVVIGLWDTESNGTQHMLEQTRDGHNVEHTYVVDTSAVNYTDIDGLTAGANSPRTAADLSVPELRDNTVGYYTRQLQLDADSLDSYYSDPEDGQSLTEEIWNRVQNKQHTHPRDTVTVTAADIESLPTPGVNESVSRAARLARQVAPTSQNPDRIARRLEQLEDEQIAVTDAGLGKTQTIATDRLTVAQKLSRSGFNLSGETPLEKQIEGYVQVGTQGAGLTPDQTRDAILSTFYTKQVTDISDIRQQSGRDSDVSSGYVSDHSIGDITPNVKPGSDSDFRSTPAPDATVEAEVVAVSNDPGDIRVGDNRRNSPGYYQQALVRDVEEGTLTRVDVFRKNIEFPDDTTDENDFDMDAQARRLDHEDDLLVPGDRVQLRNVQAKNDVSPDERTNDLTDETNGQLLSLGSYEATMADSDSGEQLVEGYDRSYRGVTDSEREAVADTITKQVEKLQSGGWFEQGDQDDQLRQIASGVRQGDIRPDTVTDLIQQVDAHEEYESAFNSRLDTIAEKVSESRSRNNTDLSELYVNRDMIFEVEMGDTTYTPSQFEQELREELDSMPDEEFKSKYGPTAGSDSPNVTIRNTHTGQDMQLYATDLNLDDISDGNYAITWNQYVRDDVGSSDKVRFYLNTDLDGNRLAPTHGTEFNHQQTALVDSTTPDTQRSAITESVTTQTDRLADRGRISDEAATELNTIADDIKQGGIQTVEEFTQRVRSIDELDSQQTQSFVSPVVEMRRENATAAEPPKPPAAGSYKSNATHTIAASGYDPQTAQALQAGVATDIAYGSGNPSAGPEGVDFMDDLDGDPSNYADHTYDDLTNRQAYYYDTMDSMSKEEVKETYSVNGDRDPDSGLKDASQDDLDSFGG